MTYNKFLSSWKRNVRLISLAILQHRKSYRTTRCKILRKYTRCQNKAASSLPVEEERGRVLGGGRGPTTPRPPADRIIVKWPSIRGPRAKDPREHSASAYQNYVPSGSSDRFVYKPVAQYVFTDLRETRAKGEARSFLVNTRNMQRGLAIP